ncbi:hypothetical protein D0Y65_032355 [Glycine soja]|uniref:Uncharacterized protein n=1 Tax=Glycine soja TaxID=3848 RepID=A0A445ICL8_GLYSO|nr:hypothetical protein D0Y65_032355 [Glycine soja]
MQNSAMEASKLSSSDQNVRCHHCAGPLSKDMETSHWTVSPLIRDSFSMIGSAVGGVASAFYGFNLVMPIVQRRIKGPMWLHFLIGVSFLVLFIGIVFSFYSFIFTKICFIAIVHGFSSY